MVMTQKTAEYEALCEKLDELKADTENTHAELTAELEARRKETKNIKQIKEVRHNIK